ncbi:hypothetical protein PBI_GAIA_135 [Mycobacterium phage Gaia]|uniref:Uncharacterized protein n=1 Tax=Mycobacterium phage Gaia TaxID=1486472 RepID=A0A068F2K1_9CAUD|nr:hypothetical protein VC46_gp098 [Mycobacterium phage Gaia]AID58954.1 hypothetical protein PBI_GAIA_135 [Mycobacterium phage Gaia]
MQVGLRIAPLTRSRGRGPSPGTCELSEFTPVIGVKPQTHHSHGHVTTAQPAARSAKLPNARSLP